MLVQISAFGSRFLCGSIARFHDGVVPALSQIHGEFRGFARGDHLDVVGHYERGPAEKRDGADWFTSGAQFDARRFDELWSDVTDVLLGGPIVSRL